MITITLATNGVNKMEPQIFQNIYQQQINHTNEFGQERKLYSLIKRIMDMTLAIIGLIIVSPLMLIAALAIKLDSPGSVLYRQDRVGKNGRLFSIIKLRSMVMDAEKDGPQWAKQGDNRVTKVGRFLRRSRIDELPQLINVLIGDMTLVGPRPERPDFTMEFNRNIPGFIDRLKVTPGITGLAQVMGGYDLEPADKLKLDRRYIKDQSLWLDVVILIMTVRIVLTGEGAR